jgi:TolB protein
MTHLPDPVSAVLALGTLIATALTASACDSPHGRPQAALSSSSPGPGMSGHLAYGRFSGSAVSLFTASADGSDPMPLLPGVSGEGPRWSPDGQLLAVVTTVGDDVVGSIVRSDGTHRRVFSRPAGAPNLACNTWSPDGRRLACEGFDDRHPALAGVFTVSAEDGRHAVRVTTHRDAPCAYSPDGSRILFLRLDGSDEEHNHLMTVDVDGSHEHLVTHQRVGLSCDWAADGTMLSEIDGSLVLLGASGDVTRIPVDGTAQRGAFSPDGSHIVFSLRQDTQEDLYTVRTDGSELRQITATPYDEEFGDWGR